VISHKKVIRTGKFKLIYTYFATIEMVGKLMELKQDDVNYGKMYIVGT
jgi:hypothetical protein